MITNKTSSVRTAKMDKVHNITSKYRYRDWTVEGFNIQKGCEHSCQYCHACEQQIRHKNVEQKNWKTPVIIEEKISKKQKNFGHRIQFPSTHDITPLNIDECLIALQNLLDADNDILIVTKPHFECIEKICEEFKNYKDKIHFMITIGSTDDKELKFWEPNAPLFNERLNSLKWVHKKGFQTSVSCEPMLDSNVDKVVKRTSPFVSDSIWIGKMEQAKRRIKTNGYYNQATREKLELLLEAQRDENIVCLALKLQTNPKVRFKTPVKRILYKYHLIEEII